MGLLCHSLVSLHIVISVIEHKHSYILDQHVGVIYTYATLVVMCVWPLYRVPPWLLCVYGHYTGCHLGYYMCMAFIQGVTLVAMCAWSLYSVSPWLLCVYGLYTGCHLGCYVCF
jgi:hypothetical protein